MTWRGCERKGRHPTEEHATAFIAARRHQWQPADWRAYQCERCGGGWHVTKAPPRASHYQPAVANSRALQSRREQAIADARRAIAAAKRVGADASMFEAALAELLR